MNKNHGTTHFEDQVDSLKDSVRGLADIGTERASDLKHRVADATDTVNLTGQRYLAMAKRFITANPLPAVAIAFGIGYVAMRIVRR